MISDYLLGAAADSYGFDRASCRFITYGREKNKQMYTFGKNKKPYVLRIDGTKTIRSCGIKVCFIIGAKSWVICTVLQETILLGMVWRNVMSFPYEV